MHIRKIIMVWYVTMIGCWLRLRNIIIIVIEYHTCATNGCHGDALCTTKGKFRHRNKRMFRVIISQRKCAGSLT